MILRLIWIEKYKVPVEDAVVFLGGRENTLLGQFLIAYLEKNQPKALEALNRFTASSESRSEQQVLGACLYNRLHPAPHHEDKDPKPAGAMSIRQAIMAKLKSRDEAK
jgi:hypothetical protein